MARTGRASSLKFPFDALLTPEIISDRDKAFTHAMEKYPGMEAMWRDPVAAPLRMVMKRVERSRCDDLVVAMFPTFVIDASLRSTPRSDPIILLHVAVTEFLARIMLTVAGMIMRRPPGIQHVRQLVKA